MMDDCTNLIFEDVYLLKSRFGFADHCMWAKLKTSEFDPGHVGSPKTCGLNLEHVG